jgi:hypothetical protein
MAKKISTRRAWTSVQVRELKTLARKRVPAAKIAKTLKPPRARRDKRHSPLDCHSTHGPETSHQALKLHYRVKPCHVRGFSFTILSRRFVGNRLCPIVFSLIVTSVGGNANESLNQTRAELPESLLL